MPFINVSKVYNVVEAKICKEERTETVGLQKKQDMIFNLIFKSKSIPERRIFLDYLARSRASSCLKS